METTCFKFPLLYIFEDIDPSLSVSLPDLSQSLELVPVRGQVGSGGIVRGVFHQVLAKVLNKETRVLNNFIKVLSYLPQIST